MKKLFTLFFFLLLLNGTMFSQLKEFVVVPESPPKLPAVFPRYAKKAAVIIHSSITTLHFSSNTGGIVDNLSHPQEGKYILILETENQYITVKNRGFREAKIFVSALKPKDVLYYTVEEKQAIVKEQGRLIINTIPSGANYQVAGFPISGNTPADFNMAVGSYKIIVSKAGYKDKSFVVEIKKGKVITKTVELEMGLDIVQEGEAEKKSNSAFSISDIKTVGGLIEGANVELTPESIIISYNLNGNYDEDYQVKLLVKSKTERDYEYEPKLVSGDIGEGKFSGSGRKIVWNIRKELPGGIDTDGLYFELTAIQASGSGWIWWTLGGVAALGGGAAYYFLKVKPQEETTQETLPSPPGRPGKPIVIGFRWSIR